MASTAPSPTHRPPPLSPTETYRLAPDTTSPVSLRIATGGAGQSGLIKALAEAFIAHHLRRRTAAAPPFFAVAWSASDTSQSFNALAHGGGGADVGITYHAEAERTALEQGVAERRAYAWRDHWMLVGPASDPAGLGSCDGGGVASVYALFKRLFRAAVATQEDAVPVRFLSRFDKSANNIKESAIWAAVGQTPWAVPYSGWYHQCVRMPFQALETAARLGEYTLTDKGTWIGVEEWVRDGMMVFKVGGDEEEDPLLNPAHVLIGSRAENKQMAHAFVDWLVDQKGGQKVIRNFASVNGAVYYSPAPLGPDLSHAIRHKL